MRKLKLIAKQVLRKNLTSFSWWLTVLTPVLILAVIAGVSFWGNQKDQKNTVAVVAPSTISSNLTQQKQSKTKYKKYASESKAQKALKNEDVDGILIVNARQTELLTVKNENQIDTSTIKSNLAMINTQTTAKAMGLSSKQLAQLLAVPEIKKQTVTFDKDQMHVKADKDTSFKMLIAQIVGLPMYFFLISYASVVAQEIGTEKGSRIEESILTAVKASTQFYGKLIGVAGLVVIQLVFYGVIALGMGIFRDKIPMIDDFIKTIPWDKIDLSFVSLVAAFYIVGIISYAILAALCGSLVSNQEQLGQIVMPIMIPAIVGYFLSMQVVHSVGMLANILSYVPFIGPIIIPVRFGIGQVSLMQVLIALAINIVFTIIFAMVSARAYKNNVLVYSDSGLLNAFKKGIRFARK